MSLFGDLQYGQGEQGVQGTGGAPAPQMVDPEMQLWLNTLVDGFKAATVNLEPHEAGFIVTSALSAMVEKKESVAVCVPDETKKGEIVKEEIKPDPL